VIVESEPSDLGSLLTVGRQNIEVGVPRGGSIAFSRAIRPDGTRMEGHVRVLVCKADGTPIKELTVDDRDVARPVSVERSL
jgi:hypothetical protein